MHLRVGHRQILISTLDVLARVADKDIFMGTDITVILGPCVVSETRLYRPLNLPV